MVETRRHQCSGSLKVLGVGAVFHPTPQWQGTVTPAESVQVPLWLAPVAVS